MRTQPTSIAGFLGGRRFAVTGVARDGRLPANAILRRLRACGYEVLAVNPHAAQLEGGPCYPDVRSLPGEVHGVVVASPPASGVEIVRQCAERGIRQVWFHRSLGDGSVSPEALRECESRGIAPIVGGCPLMFCGDVDVFHRCMRWWLQRSGRVPR
jgi:predicted CoA-binding protein